MVAFVDPFSLFCFAVFDRDGLAAAVSFFVSVFVVEEFSVEDFVDVDGRSIKFGSTDWVATGGLACSVCDSVAPCLDRYA